ncbi:hypothetical protein J6590_061984 [Homalodisca vitripennis]|nr:hypothetical protein J6590_061984 [Homalodisca vitripennis]
MLKGETQDCRNSAAEPRAPCALGSRKALQPFSKKSQEPKTFQTGIGVQECSGAPRLPHFFIGRCRGWRVLQLGGFRIAKRPRNIRKCSGGRSTTLMITRAYKKRDLIKKMDENLNKIVKGM